MPKRKVAEDQPLLIVNKRTGKRYVKINKKRYLIKSKVSDRQLLKDIHKIVKSISKRKSTRRTSKSRSKKGAISNTAEAVGKSDEDAIKKYKERVALEEKEIKQKELQKEIEEEKAKKTKEIEDAKIKAQKEIEDAKLKADTNIQTSQLDLLNKQYLLEREKLDAENKKFNQIITRKEQKLLAWIDDQKELREYNRQMVEIKRLGKTSLPDLILGPDEYAVLDSNKKIVAKGDRSKYLEYIDAKQNLERLSIQYTQEQDKFDKLLQKINENEEVINLKNKEIEDKLVEMQTIKQQLENTRHEIDEKNVENIALQGKNKNISDEMASLELKRKEMTESMETLLSTVATLQGQTEKLNKDNEDKLAEIQRTERILDETKATLESTTIDLEKQKDITRKVEAENIQNAVQNKNDVYSNRIKEYLESHKTDKKELDRLYKKVFNVPRPAINNATVIANLLTEVKADPQLSYDKFYRKAKLSNKQKEDIAVFDAIIKTKTNNNDDAVEDADDDDDNDDPNEQVDADPAEVEDISNTTFNTVEELEEMVRKNNALNAEDEDIDKAGEKVLDVKVSQNNNQVSQINDKIDEHLQSGDGYIKKFAGLRTDQIDDVMSRFKNIKYIGTPPVNQIKHLPLSNNSAFIYNTDDSSGDGKHWVACLINDNNIEIFDPLAQDIQPTVLNQIKKKLKNGFYQIKVNRVKRQKDTTDTCGYHAMKFIHDRIAKGKTFKQATGYDIFDKAIQGEKELKPFINKIQQFDVVKL